MNPDVGRPSPSTDLVERPLHVRVAEALGNEVHEVAGIWYTEAEMDAAEARLDDFSAKPIPHYDTDWSATGPLVERESICLNMCWPGDHGQDGFHWMAFRAADVRSPDAATQSLEAEGDTPLLAVCHLLLALHAAGKLEPKP